MPEPSHPKLPSDERPSSGAVQEAAPVSPSPQGSGGHTSLLLASPPPGVPQDLGPEHLEVYIRSAMHQDRAPGILIAVCHPLRMYKVPRGLFSAIEKAGWEVRRVDTRPDRVESVTAIRDALREAASEGRPLDLMVLSGDGTLDHHVLTAAFWAFFPDLVSQRPGAIDTSAVTPADLASIPDRLRAAFLEPLPTGQGIEPTEATMVAIWVLRARLERMLRRDPHPDRVTRKARLPRTDPILRLAVLATLLPHRVVLRPPGFDLSGLAQASQERAFQGLYPYIRAICCYPAGTAADNAVFSGVPGWAYAQMSGLLTRFDWLDGLRRYAERRVIRKFMRYFTKRGVVVPARISLVAFDGQWQSISSHAAGGPGAGHFFTADLTSKTKGMLGYLVRIPRVIIREGLLGDTVVRVASRYADGRLKSFTEAQLAEGLYTNRAFIAGVGTIPTTGAISLAGQSSLALVPPVINRMKGGQRGLNFRGVGAFWEAIAKGVLARALHMAGLGVGRMAGGGRFTLLPPEHQVAIKEGEEIEVHYLTLGGRPRGIPVQVSGDPFQAWKLNIRSSWSPIPILGEAQSLLLASARAVLADLRLRQSYGLRVEYIGATHYFWHHHGEDWDEAFRARTGLVQPPLWLPLPLAMVQRRLLEAWREAGAGEFVDTSQSGVVLGRRGRYAHNNDQSAHLVVLKQPGSALLVRQIRRQPADGQVYESRARYRRIGANYLIYESSTVAWRGQEPPIIVQEDHWFRDAETFQQAAPAFFPLLRSPAESPALVPMLEDDDDTEIFMLDEPPRDKKIRRKG
ncbi:MAG: hypothetical protein ABIO70_09295 [Pseudomonadota bacterium]